MLAVGVRQKTPVDGGAGVSLMTGMAYRVILKQFTPAQAAAITGVSGGLQRQWRSQGYLRTEPKTGAHARFTAVELTRLAAAKALVDCGLSYRQATHHLDRLATAMLVWAAGIPGVFDGPEDFEIRYDAAMRFREPLGEDLDSFLLIPPSGPAEFLPDGGTLQDRMQALGIFGAPVISIEGTAHLLMDRAGPLGTIIDSDAATAPEPTGSSLIRSAKAAARAHGVELYSPEGLALALSLARAGEGEGGE